MIFSKELHGLFGKAIKTHYKIAIPHKAFVLQRTQPAYTGSHTILLFSLPHFIKKPMADIGKVIGDYLITHSSWIVSYQIVQGFLNLTLSDAAWCKALTKHIDQRPQVKHKQKIVVEMSSPNTNKPLHLGHLRNTFIGDTVANILEAVGHDVQKINLINDRGIHICKSMYAYQQDTHAKTPAAIGKKGDHFVGDYYVRFDKQYKAEITKLTPELGSEEATQKAPSMLGVQKMLQAWEEGDAATRSLWQKMNTWVYEGFRETYNQLNIHFDKTYYESDIYLFGKKIVEEGLKKGIFYRKKDTSVWVDLTKEKLGHKLLLRGDGTSVYITQDLGAAELRHHDFEADCSIYVVGDEQTHHFAVLFAILKKLKRPYADRLFHLAYGMIDLPEGKMKSREGTVVDADSIIKDMVTIASKQSDALGKTKQLSLAQQQRLHRTLAIGSLKFFLLKISPQKRICFDPQKSIDFLGYTAAFVQYCYARITTMLAKTTLPEVDATIWKDITSLHHLERKLIIRLLEAHDVLHEAAAKFNPALCAHYIYQLAKTYNQCYVQLPVLVEIDTATRTRRLYLSLYTKKTLYTFANYLNIDLPEKM